MLTGRWSEVDRLFQAALDVPPEEREGFLSASCPSDPHLRNEVRSLVVRYESDGGRLENTVISASAVLRLLAHPELRPGQHLLKYEILALLGTGGMGSVYLARDLTLERNVALKVLSKGLADSLGGRESAFAEARAASSLNHPNIITVFDAGEESGRQFIAAEYVEGVTLRDRVSSGALAVGEGLAIGIQVGRALSAAHAAGVVHRDVKPENIMVRPDGVVKVLDFGIARVRGGAPAGKTATSGTTAVATPEAPGDETGREPIVGSLAYMSPEQALGTPIDSRSDIFSFGTLLFELFTGSRPFSGGSNLSTLMAVVGNPAVFPRVPRLPNQLRRVIQQCLEKNPGDRPQRIEEVVLVLEKLNGRKQPAAVRNRRIWWAGGCGAAALLVLAALWWVRNPPAAHFEYFSRQLTHDGNYKDPVIVASDTEVFFHEVVNWERSAVKLSLPSGELHVMDFPAAEPGAVVELEDYSTRSGDLLYRTWIGDYERGSFHVFNELDATDSKVPGLLGYAGNWSPDGKRLAYFSRPPWGVYTADLTGAADLIFPVQTPGPWRRTIAWSPDGRTLRFAKNDRLYEVSADGKNPHPVFDSPSAPQGAGRWSPDGSRFVYADDWTGDLWSVTEGRGFPAKQEFTRITSGPMQFGTPVLSPDGRTIYAVGQTKRGRLNRYDPGSQSWQPAMGGLSVDGVDYSKDGKFVAYVGFPRRAIGIRRRDGGASRDLTTPPMRGYLPRFSPDGKQVAFMGKMPGQRWRIYLSSVEGSTGESTPRPLPTGANGGEEPNWSPDGSRIVYASVPWDSTGGPNLMYQYDLASGRVSTIPGSEGLFSPRWSPDGRYIAANRFEHYGMNPFVLLDPVSGKRTEFPERMRGVFPAWSRDSRSLYFLNKAPLNPAKVFKLSIDRRTVELVATFQNRIIANSPLPSLDSLWMGLAPDETPLLLEDVGSREIYEILQANMVTSRGRK